LNPTHEDIIEAQAYALAYPGELNKKVGPERRPRWEVYLTIVRADSTKLPRDWTLLGPIPQRIEYLWYARSYRFWGTDRRPSHLWDRREQVEGLNLSWESMKGRGTKDFKKTAIGYISTHVVRSLSAEELAAVELAEVSKGGAR
jgi:hypothetical protein